MTLRDSAADLQALLALATDPARFFDRLRSLAWYRELLDSWVTAVGAGPGMTVLDAGCGPGRLSVLLAGRGANVDRSDGMLQRAWAQPLRAGAEVVF